MPSDGQQVRVQRVLVSSTHKQVSFGHDYKCTAFNISGSRQQPSATITHIHATPSNAVTAMLWCGVTNGNIKTLPG
jgi:hypothetical protein